MAQGPHLVAWRVFGGIKDVFGSIRAAFGYSKSTWVASMSWLVLNLTYCVGKLHYHNNLNQIPKWEHEPSNDFGIKKHDGGISHINSQVVRLFKKHNLVLLWNATYVDERLLHKRWWSVFTIKLNYFQLYYNHTTKLSGLSWLMDIHH